jgi:hypothetical protein
MGNFLYNVFFGQPKIINEAAFEYRLIKTSVEQKAIFEIETDDFIDKKGIKAKLLALPDPDNLIHNRIETDFIPALTYYLQNDSKLYTNKAILAQTDYFIFKANYIDTVPLLLIKNTQAESNRIKFSYSNNIADANAGYYTATCILSNLWTGVSPSSYTSYKAY